MANWRRGATDIKRSYPSITAGKPSREAISQEPRSQFCVIPPSARDDLCASHVPAQQTFQLAAAAAADVTHRNRSERGREFGSAAVARGRREAFETARIQSSGGCCGKERAGLEIAAPRVGEWQGASD